MNRENAKLLAPIIEAYGNGEQIQTFDGKKWQDVAYPDFDCNAKDYRIKPKKRTIWVEINEYGVMTRLADYEFVGGTKFVEASNASN